MRSVGVAMSAALTCALAHMFAPKFGFDEVAAIPPISGTLTRIVPPAFATIASTLSGKLLPFWNATTHVCGVAGAGVGVGVGVGLAGAAELSVTTSPSSSAAASIRILAVMVLNHARRASLWICFIG